VSASGSVQIQPVLRRSELRQFLKLPFRLYRDNPCWVPPLWVDRMAFFDVKKNPFYRTAEVALFLARRGGEPVGRIAACVNHDYNEFHGEQTGSFGFFEAVNDRTVAHALLDTAAEWLAARGQKRILGPLNFSTNHDIGFLADAYDLPPVIMMPYNPPYYLKLAEGWGLVPTKDVLAFKYVADHPVPERIRRIAERVKKRTGIRIRNIDPRQFDREIQRVREIYNQAWSKNWGFVPLTEAEFAHIAKDLKLALDPRLAHIAEVEGRPVGFSLSVPDVFKSQIRIRSGRLFPTGLLRLLWDLKIRRSIRSIRTLTMGVIHEYQRRGIEAAFYIETIDQGTAAGYEWTEISWVLEDNDMMIKAAEALGSRRYKTYRVYHKEL
jgi:GNAT superfamily N-acetyltransferase